ncbi:hypothetical protein BGC07_16950 [Piscirickettsia litoralis]|uniref:AAA domain-containing protein n=2 Tax=Piscirickettsia litoralis TaxID=1891921 RepID=A0ABX3A1D2_9GAMM|nr:hypothetical protein BGC07_16950 [Piscirickettsia litoralis]
MKSAEYATDYRVQEPKMSVSNAAEFLGLTVQAVHKQLKAKNIVCPKIGNKTYINHDIAKQLFGLKFNQKVIAAQIVKGGTGKTTAIENVASCANTYGAKILKIDTDPQGNLTDANGVDAENYPVLIDVIKDDANIQDSVVSLTNSIDLIPSRIENVILDNVIVNEMLPLHSLYGDLLAPIIDNYDYVFIDCPPTMGQAVTAASLYADIVLAPLNPDKFSAKGLKILKKEIDVLNKRFKKKIDYRVFLNKFSAKTILSDKAIMSLISDPGLQGNLLETTVQFSQEIPNLTDDNKNLFSHLKKSIARSDFDRLTQEVLELSPTKVKKVQTKVKSKKRTRVAA